MYRLNGLLLSLFLLVVLSLTGQIANGSKWLIILLVIIVASIFIQFMLNPLIRLMLTGMNIKQKNLGVLNNKHHSHLAAGFLIAAFTCLLIGLTIFIPNLVSFHSITFYFIFVYGFGGFFVCTSLFFRMSSILSKTSKKRPNI